MKLALIALGLLATSGVEAIEMYARFLKARHGVAAAAREKAEALKLRGDIEGHVVWSRVADAVEHRFPSIVLGSVTPLS